MQGSSRPMRYMGVRHIAYSVCICFLEKFTRDAKEMASCPLSVNSYR